MTDVAIYGAGAVGLVLGARLARAGSAVLFVTRGSEQASLLARDGVRFEDPATGDAWSARVDAVAGAAAAAPRLGRAPVLFCMRVPDLEGAADALGRATPGARVASFQNDVDNESALARRFDHVIGAVVRQTCTRIAPDAARATGAGRIVLGDHPTGAGRDAQALADRLRTAGYDVGLSGRISEDLWLKLVVNLMSAPNALVRRADHTTRAFVELKARLLEEGRDACRAAGIRARSCDGRDRSLDEEVRWQRESLARGQSARALPLHNQVWSALAQGGPLEADRYHRRIIDLAARHAVPAPQNQRVLDVLEGARRDGLGPECVSAADLLVAA